MDNIYNENNKPSLKLDSTMKLNNNNNHHTKGNNDLENISNFRRALPQFLAVSVKNILLFAYGTTLGFPTIVIPAVQNNKNKIHNDTNADIVLNSEEISWFSSINLICVPLGCLFSGILSQPIGKRRAMQFVNVPLLISWILFHFATNTTHLYIALCLSGLGGGLMEAPVLTYVAEITEPKYRGILSALGSTCVITGIFVQYIMGSFMHWRTIALVSSIFPFICIIALFFVPESPIWLIRRQDFTDGIKALQWLRGWVSKEAVEGEFNQLYDELITQPALEAIDENKLGTGTNQAAYARILRMFKKRSFVAPFLLVAYTFFTGHFSGKTSLQTYAVQIFNSLKAPINEYYATILLGVADMLATVLGVILIHFTGKRPLVMTSTIGVGLCLFLTATYARHLNIDVHFSNNYVNSSSSLNEPRNISDMFELQKSFEINNETLANLPEYKFINETFNNLNYQDMENVNNQTLFLSSNQIISKKSDDTDNANNFIWLPMVLLLGSAFFAHLGIRMIPWILIGEVFPATIRSAASGLVSSLGYIFGFLANKLFLQMLATLTLPGIFWFYSIVSFTGAIVLYYVLPETEGRTLGEIEAHFSKKSSTNLLCKKQQEDFKKNQRQQKLMILNIKSNQINYSNNVKDTSIERGCVNKAFDDTHITHL